MAPNVRYSASKENHLKAIFHLQQEHGIVTTNALAAALHCAVDLKDEPRVAGVGRAADMQLAWIDAHDPAYMHSSQSARGRGHSSIFAMLELQARGNRQILHPRGAAAPL